nr:hypothetical protein [Leptolyngbya sp. 7M]
MSTKLPKQLPKQSSAPRDDRGRVTDRANPKLEGIREQIRQVRDRIYEQLQRLMQRHSNAVQEPLITQRGDRFVIPVKASHKDAIPGVVHDTSTSGVTLYIEPHAIVNSGNQLRQLLRQEQREEEEVRRQLTEQVAAVKSDLERLLVIATTLDLATARARYSLWLNANPPRFVRFYDDGGDGGDGGDKAANLNPQLRTQNLKLKTSSVESIVLRQLRHPLLVWQQQHEQGMPVVPIDLVIQPQIRVVAITGPNTGGKTVTLKTLGLAVLMAKVGLFVPAKEPVELCWFDQVLADIGDEQSLQQSLSTFSGHIRRISRILEAMDLAAHRGKANVLVLLDEVGAGTDPSEGSALATALLKYLADHAALTIATTHFGDSRNWSESIKYGKSLSEPYFLEAIIPQA